MARAKSPAPSASKAHEHDEEVDQDFDLSVHLTAHSPLIAVLAVLLALLVWYYPTLSCWYHNKPGHTCSDANLEMKWLSARCPAGTYCEGSWSAPKMCPAGTISTQDGVTALSACKPCPVGQFSSQLGFQGHQFNSTCTLCWKAPAGSYCPEGSTSPSGSVCKAGHTCAGGSAAPVAVPAGFYAPANSTHLNVKPCPAGTGSDKEGTESEAECVACAAGKYQWAAGSTYCDEAAKGFYVPTAKAIAQLPCPAGQFQHEAGQSSCMPCKKGMYNKREGQAACNVAEAADFTNTTFFAGYYVPEESAMEPTKCPWGTQTLLTGQDHCEACPVGQNSSFYEEFVKDAAGVATKEKVKIYTGCKPCGPGYFGGVGKEATCELCPAGSYSSATGAHNIETCTPCEVGEYGDLAGATDRSVACKPCNVNIGFHCPAGGNEDDGVQCPEKMFCAGGAAAPAIIQAGHHVTAGKSEVKCVPGTWLPNSTEYLAAWRDGKGLYPCRPATPGHKVDAEGASVQTACAAGTYSDEHNAVTCKACKKDEWSHAGESKCHQCAMDQPNGECDAEKDAAMEHDVPAHHAKRVEERRQDALKKEKEAKEKLAAIRDGTPY